MGFVFVLRSAAHRGRANQLAKALRSRGLDVCVGLENEPAEVRASISRSLVDHCAVMAALWTDGDLGDASFIEPMRYAASRGKLVAIGVGGGLLPANLAPNPDLARAWPGDAAGLRALVDMIADAVSRTLAPNEWAGATSFTASEEYAAAARMHKRPNVEAMARFLREFPGGMFEDIVRAELDAATRPEYEPAGKRRAWAFGGGEATAPDEPSQVWRMGGWQPLRVFENFDVRWLWGGAAALGVAALAVGAVAFWPALPIGGETRAQREAGRALAEAPASRVRIGPADVRAAPIEPETAPEPAAPAAAETAAAALEMALAEEAADQPIVLNNAPDPIEPPALQPSAAASETAPIAEAPTTQVLRVPESSTGDRVMRDITRLDPVVRNAVERARRSEASALTAAAARTTAARIVVARPNAGAGLYHGEWSDDAAHGLGRAVWGNGDVYAGSWRGSAPHGYGVLALASGMQYEGEFSAGAPTGRGVFWGADGRRLTGDRLFAALVSARTR